MGAAQIAAAQIADFATQIEALFHMGAKVTILVRNPAFGPDANVLVTADDRSSIVAAINAEFDRQ